MSVFLTADCMELGTASFFEKRLDTLLKKAEGAGGDVPLSEGRRWKKRSGRLWALVMHREKGKGRWGEERKVLLALLLLGLVKNWYLCPLWPGLHNIMIRMDSFIYNTIPQTQKNTVFLIHVFQNNVHILNNLKTRYISTFDHFK